MMTSGRMAFHGSPLLCNQIDHGYLPGRPTNGRSDTLDAEDAARAVAKCAHANLEVPRRIAAACDTEVKARTGVIITLTQMVINAPAKLREILDPVADTPSLTALARFRRITLPVGSTIASAKHTFLPSPNAG